MMMPADHVGHTAQRLSGLWVSCFSGFGVLDHLRPCECRLGTEALSLFQSIHDAQFLINMHTT